MSNRSKRYDCPEREQKLIRIAQDSSVSEERRNDAKKELINKFGWGKKKTSGLKPIQ